MSETYDQRESLWASKSRQEFVCRQCGAPATGAVNHVNTPAEPFCDDHKPYPTLESQSAKILEGIQAFGRSVTIYGNEPSLYLAVRVADDCIRVAILYQPGDPSYLAWMKLAENWRAI